MELQIGIALFLCTIVGNLGASSSKIDKPPKVFPTSQNGLSAEPEPIIPYEFPSDKVGINPSSLDHDKSESELPPKIFPDSEDDESRYAETKEDIEEAKETLKKAIVPFEFPETAESNYTFIINSTIRENLASRSEHSTSKPGPQNDTEVEDLRHGGLELIPKEVAQKPEKSEEVKSAEESNSEEKTSITVSDSAEDLNNEVELLQKVGSKAGNEDGRRLAEERGRGLAKMHANHDHYQRLGAPLVHGQLAIIMSIVFVAVAIIAYVALITWRRFLENRYGNRELLVNEDIYDPSDLRNFEL